MVSNLRHLYLSPLQKRQFTFKQQCWSQYVRNIIPQDFLQFGTLCISEYSRIQKFQTETPVIRNSGSRLPSFLHPEIAEFRHFGITKFQYSDIPEFQHSGIPTFRCSDIPEFRNFSIPAFRHPDIFIPIFQNLYIVHFRNYDIPEF